MALIKCEECTGQVSEHAHSCPHCGYPLDELTLPVIAKGGTLNARIIDFDMSFTNLVYMLVKLVLAAIPALLILGAICLLLVIAIGIMSGAFNHSPAQ